MSDKMQKKPGDFCWWELASTNLAASKKYYEDLFGWTSSSHEMPQGGEYSMMAVDGAEIGGGFEITEEMSKQGIPPHWGSYVLVDSVDEMTKKAKSLGATVLKEPFDVMEYGRMSVLLDPSKAVISLWQLSGKCKKEGDDCAGYPDSKTHGMISWNELLTDDVEKSGKFYCDLFGWQQQTQEYPGDMKYTSFINNGVPIAGMMAKTEACKQYPNCWGIYMTTTDFDASLEKAKSLGGEMMYDPKDIPGVGKITMIKDPDGAYFSLIQYA